MCFFSSKITFKLSNFFYIDLSPISFCWNLNNTHKLCIRILQLKNVVKIIFKFENIVFVKKIGCFSVLIIIIKLFHLYSVRFSLLIFKNPWKFSLSYFILWKNFISPGFNTDLKPATLSSFQLTSFLLFMCVVKIKSCKITSHAFNSQPSLLFFV